MRKLITTTFVTLDGVLQAPGGPEEDLSGHFAHGGWSFPYWCDEVERFMTELMGKPFDLVLGRKTYEIFASYWPDADQGIGATKPLNDAVKYVASRGRPSLTWDRSELIDGDVAEGVRALKHTDGPELQIHGSGALIQSLLGSDVIDEMRVITYPVTVGNGKRLFGEGTVPRQFRVSETVVAGNGVIMVVYQPDGALRTGSFA